MSTAPPNSRASLLAGLRTGGVRSASGPMMPHTAAPGGSFQIPRFASAVHQSPYDEDEAEELSDMMGQTLHIAPPRQFQQPMTASAADATAPRFQQQQQQQQQILMQAAAQRAAFNGQYADMQTRVNMQAQMQLQMQMEILRLQAIQQQQYQNEVYAQAQRHQQIQQLQQLQQPQHRILSGGNRPPATAGPLQTSFDLRGAGVAAQLRAARTEQALAPADDSVPMTAALDGKFGSRGLNPNTNAFVPRGLSVEPEGPPSTPSYTTVISGGTSLGNGASTPKETTPPSKSDSAVSWRRGGSAPTLNRTRSGSPPSVTVSKSDDDVSPPLASAQLPGVKARPQPLQFNVNPVPAFSLTEDGVGEVVIPTADSPTTPTTSSSSLSAREEAAKKLYEGLGMGRPSPQPTAPAAAIPRQVSQPVRQPRGPPSGVEDLGQKNFASRIRRKAIGGLGALLGARERRENVALEVEAY